MKHGITQQQQTGTVRLERVIFKILCLIMAVHLRRTVERFLRIVRSKGFTRLNVSFLEERTKPAPKTSDYFKKLENRQSSKKGECIRSNFFFFFNYTNNFLFQNNLAIGTEILRIINHVSFKYFNTCSMLRTTVYIYHIYIHIYKVLCFTAVRNTLLCIFQLN